jgi:hypothetical protein
MQLSNDHILMPAPQDLLPCTVVDEYTDPGFVPNCKNIGSMALDGMTSTGLSVDQIRTVVTCFRDHSIYDLRSADLQDLRFLASLRLAVIPNKAVIREAFRPSPSPIRCESRAEV